MNQIQSEMGYVIQINLIIIITYLYFEMLLNIISFGEFERVSPGSRYGVSAS